MNGWLHKRENRWIVKWYDVHSFFHGIHWMETPIHPSDQITDEMEGVMIYFNIMTYGYDSNTFVPNNFAKLKNNE